MGGVEVGWEKLSEVNSRKAEARRLGGVLTDSRIVRT